MVIVLYLATSLAIAAALFGGWFTVQSFGSGARAVDRRLSGALHASGAPADAEADKAKAATGLDTFLDNRMPGLRRRLLSAGAPFQPSHLVLGSLGAFGALLALLPLIGVPALLALAVAAWSGLAAPTVLVSALARRRRRRFVGQMPQAIELMARGLQAGHPVTTAMATAARQMPDPMGPELSVVIGEMSYGLNRDAALRNLLARFTVPELQMFVASLEVTRETGGNVAEVLLKLAEAMRAKAQLRKKVAAISAEGRMSFWVVSGLPVGIVAILMAVAPSYYREVTGDPLFWPLMCIPPALWAIGALMIWRMINFRI